MWLFLVGAASLLIGYTLADSTTDMLFGAAVWLMLFLSLIYEELRRLNR